MATLPDGPLPPGPWAEQPLFGPGAGKVGKNHPPTSHYAARLTAPRTGTNRYTVLRAVVRAGARGMTDDEIRGETGMRYSTSGPRRRELVEQGWIEDSGQVRASESGAPMIVWRLTQRGHDAWLA